jgi:hypothetical protein
MFQSCRVQYMWCTSIQKILFWWVFFWVFCGFLALLVCRVLYGCYSVILIDSSVSHGGCRTRMNPGPIACYSHACYKLSCATPLYLLFRTIKKRKTFAKQSLWWWKITNYSCALSSMYTISQWCEWSPNFHFIYYFSMNKSFQEVFLCRLYWKVF